MKAPAAISIALLKSTLVKPKQLENASIPIYVALDKSIASKTEQFINAPPSIILIPFISTVFNFSSLANKHSEITSIVLAIETLSKDVKLLNAALHDQIQNECQKYEVVIYSVNIRENNVSDLKQCIEFAKKTSPDFIILQADFNYNFNQIKPIIEYNLCTKIDILIKSNFMLYDRDFIYCQSAVDEKMLYCESDNFMNTLSKKIFSKISFPEGCIVI